MPSQLLQVVEEDTLDPFLADIATRLADEGVPVRAIARSIRQNSEIVRYALHDAIANGQIVRLPREDWPSNTRFEDREPDGTPKKLCDTEVALNCVRLFKVTKLQAALLSILIKRTEVTKSVMHQIIEQERHKKEFKPNKKETNVKMVDVVICNLRKRLKPAGLEIKTLWASGYYMEADQRAKANALLQSYAGQFEATSVPHLQVVKSDGRPDGE